MSDSLLPLFKKEQPRIPPPSFPQRSDSTLYKKATMSESLSKNEWFTSFSLFPPLFMPKSTDHSHRSSLSLALLWRETEAIRSHRSLKKSNCEQIAPVALYKRATVSDLLLSLMTKEQRGWFALFHEPLYNIRHKTQDLSKKNSWDFFNTEESYVIVFFT